LAIVGYVEPQSAQGETKEIFESTLKGRPNNLQKALAQTPEILKGFLALFRSVGKHLDRRLYELLYIRASIINGCHY